MSGLIHGMKLDTEKRFTTLSDSDLEPYLGHDVGKRTLQLLVDKCYHVDGYVFVEAITEEALSEGRRIIAVDSQKSVRGSNWYKVIADRAFLNSDETCGELTGCHIAAPPTSIDYVDEEDMVCRFGWIHKDDIRAWFDPNEKN